VRRLHVSRGLRKPRPDAAILSPARQNQKTAPLSITPKAALDVSQLSFIFARMNQFLALAVLMTLQPAATNSRPLLAAAGTEIGRPIVIGTSCRLASTVLGGSLTRYPDPPLATLRNIGKAALADLELLGVSTCAELALSEPDELFARLQEKTGMLHDPCVHDVLAAAIHECRSGEAIDWWHFTHARKLGRETTKQRRQGSLP
jgi:pathogenicity locus Cdd1 protein